MKKLNLSIIHIIIAVVALMFGSARAQSIEIVPYRLVPSHDVHCQIQIELVEPVTFLNLPDIYKQEIHEILLERAVFEETNPFAINEPFRVDDKFYQLIRIPNTGDTWNHGGWNHQE